MEAIDCVETDFGTVVLSERVLSYLDSIDKDWRVLLVRKPRSNVGKNNLQKVRLVIDAVQACSAIAWHGGEVLKRF